VEQQKVGKQGRDDSVKQFSVQPSYMYVEWIQSNSMTWPHHRIWLDLLLR